jgi:DNA-binding CsgD family transcriptional regulator
MPLSKSARLRESDYRTILEIVGECRDLADDDAVWREHFLRATATLVGADIVMGGEMAGVRARRPVSIGAVHCGWEAGFDQTQWERSYRDFAAGRLSDPTVNECFARVAVPDGEASIAQLLGERGWYRSSFYEIVYSVVGLDANLYSFHPVPGASDEFSGMILARAMGRPAFDARETGVVREAQAAIARLVGGALVRFKEPCPSALAPRARQVLKCLLEGDGDKQVAVRLALSPFTVNQYTKTIYRHFGVTSRAELLARWIARGWGAAAHWATHCNSEDSGPGGCVNV